MPSENVALLGLLHGHDLYLTFIYLSVTMHVGYFCFLDAKGLKYVGLCKMNQERCEQV
jgi:hypothetical protein